MDPLLILKKLEVLIQFKNKKQNYVSQFHNPNCQFRIDSWIQITRTDIFLRIFYLNLRVKGLKLNPFKK